MNYSAGTIAVSLAQLNLYRQWFDSVQDTNPQYLGAKDYAAAKVIYEALGMRAPNSLSSQVDEVPCKGCAVCAEVPAPVVFDPVTALGILEANPSWELSTHVYGNGERFWLVHLRHDEHEPYVKLIGKGPTPLSAIENAYLTKQKSKA